VEHCGFPRASRSGGLGCGKLTSAHWSPAHRRPHGWQNRSTAATAHAAFLGEPSRPGQARVRAARYVHTMWTVLWTTSVVTDQALATRRGEGSASVTDTDLTDVWARSLEGLAELHVQPSQLAWLKLTRPLGLVENTALIATPNAFVKEQL